MALPEIVCNDTGFTPTLRLHRKELQYWLPTSGKLNHPFHLVLSPLGGVEEASQVTLGLLPTLVVLIGFLFLSRRESSETGQSLVWDQGQDSGCLFSAESTPHAEIDVTREQEELDSHSCPFLLKIGIGNWKECNSNSQNHLYAVP